MDELRPRVSDSGRDDYVIRPFEPGDREDVLSLNRTVWDTDRDRDWFEWKYGANPYLDGPAMIVASTGDEVVGARPFFPVPMATGRRELTAVFCRDLMVHPDHRRRGLFIRMMERAMRADVDGAVMFNFANEKSAPGFRKLGWREAGTGPGRSFRIQWPAADVVDRLDGPAGRLAGVAATALSRVYLASRSVGRPSPDGSLSVDRQEGIPGEQLAALYERRVPQSVHARREPRLYQWLTDNPLWTYDTYVASRRGDPVAAIVIRRRADRRNPVVEIVDAVPLAAGERERAFAAILHALLSDWDDAPLLTVIGPVVYERLLPRGLLARFGFHSSTSPPLSWFATKGNTMFVFPHDADDLRLDGLDLTDPEDWFVRVRDRSNRFATLDDAPWLS